MVVQNGNLYALTFLIKVRGILCLFALLFPFIIYGQSDIEVRDSLSASYVSGHIDRNHNRTQTGLTRFDSDSFYRGYAVFSAPDVLKTLQVFRFHHYIKSVILEEYSLLSILIS